MTDLQLDGPSLATSVLLSQSTHGKAKEAVEELREVEEAEAEEETEVEEED